MQLFEQTQQEIPDGDETHKINTQRMEEGGRKNLEALPEYTGMEIGKTELSQS